MGDIQKEVSKYCQVFDIKQIGNNTDSHDDNIIASIMNKLYSHHVAQTNSTASIKLISTGMSDTKFKFIYTTNHRLFQCFEDDKLEEMNQSFLRHKHDEIIDIKCGKKHCLFLTKNGDVFCIGSNDSGQCGMEVDVFYVPTPTLIPMTDDGKIKSIACGNFHSLFIDEKQRLLCCGYSYLGQCGMASTQTNMSASYPITNGSDFESDSSEFSDETSTDELSFSMIDSSEDDSSDDEAEAENHQVIWRPTLNPYFADSDAKIMKIECGMYHSLCLTQKGECFAFGSNYFGNLGNGKCCEFGEGIHEPLRVETSSKIIDIAAGNNHNLLLTQQNEILSFGSNANGQCGSSGDRITAPIVISKERDCAIGKDSYVEKLLCLNDKSLVIIDPFKRAGI